MLTGEKRHRVGYALALKKIQTIFQPSLIEYASQHNIDLIPIDPTEPLSEQGPFDCILHKRYDPDWTTQLHYFSTENPTIPIIDSPRCIEKLHDRISMLQVVQNLTISRRNEVLDVPKQHVVLESETLKVDSAVIKELGFPLIAKPVRVDGSEISHRMYLVFDEEGLGRLDNAPIVLQEFVSHGGVLFKVYVVGDYVQCVKRKSLPDITEEKLKRLKGLLPFSQISSLAVEGKGGFESVEMPPEDFVVEVARALRKEMGLNLFNFDMIRDAKDRNRYLVIDINYFPGYAKMPNYEPVLTTFLLDVIGKKDRGEVGVRNIEDSEQGKQD